MRRRIWSIEKVQRRRARPLGDRRAGLRRAIVRDGRTVAGRLQTNEVEAATVTIHHRRIAAAREYAVEQRHDPDAEDRLDLTEEVHDLGLERNRLLRAFEVG